jgi:hypothetical protein
VGVAALRFLIGEWRGDGLLRGRPVKSRVVAAEFGPDMIRLDNETSADGAPLHRERVVFRAKDGRVQASTSPWRGDAQVFEVEETAAGFVLTCGARYRWTIVREGDDAWAETFETADAVGRLEPVVTLRHVRA